MTISSHSSQEERTELGVPHDGRSTPSLTKFKAKSDRASEFHNEILGNTEKFPWWSSG